MPQENQPIVVAAKWVAGPSRQVSARDDLLRPLWPQIEKFVRQLRDGTDLTARATSGFEELLLGEHRAIRGADVTAAGDSSEERFPHEKDCQNIVLTFATKHCGYDYPKRDRSTIRQLCDITERHACSVGRDTVKAILQEADQRTGCWRNREKSYYKLIYALAHEFCGGDEGGVSPKAAEKIASLVRKQGHDIEIEVVKEILQEAARVVESSF